MIVERRVCAYVGMTLVLCACGSRGSSRQKASSTDDDSGAQSSPSWKLDQVSDPYVAWLAGRGAQPQWPPEPIPGLLRAAGLSAEVAVEPPWPTLIWDQTGLSVTWDATVPTPGRRCSELGPAIDAYLEKSEFGAPPAGARRDIRLFYSAARGVERLISHTCVEPDPNAPGCTGGDCSQPTTLSIQYAVGLRGGGLASLDAALEPFPTVSKPLHETLLPPFLVEVVRSARFQSLYCERWAGSTCEWDLRFEVTPPGDAKKWIRQAIEIAKRYGFDCDQSWRDPEKEEISSTQACSGRQLWYSVKHGRVRIRLAAIIGAEPEGTPVQCSASYFAEKGHKPPPPVDPGVQEILGVPVRKSAVAHMDRVLDCYIEHQESAGRSVEMSDWRRLGDFLQRTGHDSESGQEVTVGVQHKPYMLPTANGFFVRIKRQVRDDLAIEMYLRQEDFQKPLGGGHVELKGHHGVPLFRVTLPWPDASAPAGSEQTFIEAAIAAVKDAHQRALQGIGRRQECEVLPNMGQECNWVETTTAEQSELRKRLEADRDKLRARIRADRAEIFGLVTDLYPWSSDGCALLHIP